MCSITEPVVLDLPRSVEAPGRARDLVELHLCREHCRAAVAAAQLVVSELVTSAVLYGQEPISLRLACEVTELRVSVDHRTTVAPGTDVPIDEEGGLRSALLGKLSRSWGTEDVEGGRTLWACLPTGALPTRSAPATPAGPAGDQGASAPG